MKISSFDMHSSYCAEICYSCNRIKNLRCITNLLNTAFFLVVSFLSPPPWTLIIKLGLSGNSGTLDSTILLQVSNPDNSLPIARPFNSGVLC